jgi:hypothetical protein
MAPSAVVSDIALPASIPESLQTPANAAHGTLFSLKSKTVVITGGGRGLGITLAAAVLEAGGHVACLDILDTPSAAEWASLQKTAKLSGLSASYHKCDITNEDQLSQTMDEIASQGLRQNAPFYGAIACAGIQQKVPAVDYPAADFERIMKVNVTGTFLTAKHSARILISSGVKGSIVMIASMSGQVANRVSTYCPVCILLSLTECQGPYLHCLQHKQSRCTANVPISGTRMGTVRNSSQYIITRIYKNSDDR